MNDLTNRIRTIRDALTEGLVERDVAVRLALLAALTGEHLLLVGPPGTAKSLVARRLCRAFKDAAYFERLLTKFSVPEELFGPLSIKGLEEDRYERLTASYLPTASVAFLDEIFKANSAILNALLTLLNEREFDNGASREETPLVAVVGASNELPEGEELDALFDRFLLRLHVDPVSKDAFPGLLKLRGEVKANIPKELGLTQDDLGAVRKEAEKVWMPDDVTALLCELRDWCGEQGIPVSDRRWRKVVKLLQTSAWTSGRDAVSIWDCWLLQHCLWSKAEDGRKIYEWYASRVGAVAEEPSRLVRMIQAWEGRFRKDEESRSQKQDEEGRLLYSGKDGKDTTHRRGQNYRHGEPLYVLPKGAYSKRMYDNEKLDETNKGKGYTEKEIEEKIPVIVDGRYFVKDTDELPKFTQKKGNRFMVDLSPAMEPTRHEPVHIRDCLRQLEEFSIKMVTHEGEIEKRIETLENDVRGHLWVMDDFTEPASRGLEKARGDAEGLIERLEKVKRGYKDLPRKEEEPGSISGDSNFSRHIQRVLRDVRK